MFANWFSTLGFRRGTRAKTQRRKEKMQRGINFSGYVRLYPNNQAFFAVKATFIFSALIVKIDKQVEKWVFECD
jgi:hypothetical protein